MIICQASLVGANGLTLKQEKITVPALTKTENGDFLVSKIQASPFQILLLQGRAKLPQGNYCFKRGSFFMKDMLCHCDIDNTFTIKLTDKTTVFVRSKTDTYDHLPTLYEEYFQIQAGDIISKGAIISLDPYYDANMAHPSIDGFFIVTLN